MVRKFSGVRIPTVCLRDLVPRFVMTQPSLIHLQNLEDTAALGTNKNMDEHNKQNDNIFSMRVLLCFFSYEVQINEFLVLYRAESLWGGVFRDST